MSMSRRQFTQATTLALGSALVPKTLAATEIKKAALGETKSGPGEWRTVPAARSIFEWHKVVARPRSSPGLTNWCFLDQNPESQEIVLSFAEIIDPTGKMVADAPRMDFSGLQRTQRFLISRDRGESWQTFAEHPITFAPDTWVLNGSWEKLKFLPGGKIVGFKSEHTQRGRRPMLFYAHSLDRAKTWTPWRPVTDDPKRGMFAGDLCQLQDGRWIHFQELYDTTLPTFRNRIRRQPPVWMDRASSVQRIGCAISEDGGMSWRDRPDLDLSLEEDVNAGNPFEPAAAQLKDGSILVVARRHRFSALGGEGLPWWQWVLAPTPDGFKVLLSQECLADVPLGPTGHPELICTRDGIVLGVRSDGLWASVDEGKYWEKIDSQYLGYYPQGIELDEGSLLIVGHLGGDNYWPPERDQEVRLTKLRLDRTPILRNLDRTVPVGYTLEDQVHRDVRARARIGTEGTAGLLARAHVKDGKLSGYVFYCTAKQPAWLLGRLENGKLRTVASGKLPGMSLTTGLRPRLELAVVGDVVRAFVNTYPVASGRDRHFAEGHAGLVAQGGRVRVESFEVLTPTGLQEYRWGQRRIGKRPRRDALRRGHRQLDTFLKRRSPLFGVCFGRCNSP